MPIDVSCTSCGRSYRLADELAGKKFRCKDCNELVLIAARNSSPSANSATSAAAKPAATAKPAAVAGPTAASTPDRRLATPGSKVGERQPAKGRREQQRAPRSTSGRGNRARSSERGSVRWRSTESSAFDDLTEYDEYGYEDAAAEDPWETQSALPQRRGRHTSSQSSRTKKSAGSGWPKSTLIAAAGGGIVVIVGVMLLWNRGLTSDPEHEDTAVASLTSTSDAGRESSNGGVSGNAAADNTAQDSAVKLADLSTRLYDALREADRRLPLAGQPLLTPDQQRQILLNAGIDAVRTEGQVLGMHLKQTGSPGKIPLVAEAFRDQARERLRDVESTLQQLRGRLDPGLIAVLQLWHAELTKQSGILWRRHAQQ